MASEQQLIPAKVLDDLCSRFIINIPSEQRLDLVRILFAVELAHWFYIDFYCEDGDELQKCTIKDFAQQIFRHCPFLRDGIANLDEILSRWRDYKYSVPTYGAILIDPSYEYILLVQGFYSRESWGFPKGKVQENESPFKCAIREVMEEVGFDMRDRAFEDQYLERDFNGQIVRLYLVQQVPIDTKFVAKMKNEIKEMRWFPIADLPCHYRDTTPQIKLNLNAKAFFMVIPFLKDLRRWINQEREIAIPRYRAMTYHLPLVVDGQSKTSEKQITVQHTIQRHFSQILKNDSMRVTDETSMTASLLKKGNDNSSHPIQLIPLMSNDDENQHPLDQIRRPLDRKKAQEPLSNIFHFNGPRCWTRFRLNRSEVFRCLHE